LGTLNCLPLLNAFPLSIAVSKMSGFFWSINDISSVVKSTRHFGSLISINSLNLTGLPIWQCHLELYFASDKEPGPFLLNTISSLFYLFLKWLLHILNIGGATNCRILSALIPTQKQVRVTSITSIYQRTKADFAMLIICSELQNDLLNKIAVLAF